MRKNRRWERTGEWGTICDKNRVSFPQLNYDCPGKYNTRIVIVPVCVADVALL